MHLRKNIFLWLLIVLGIALRMTDVGFPDISTDEAQLALGKSAAWTPLAMQTIVIVQSIFGFETIVARGASVVIGITTLPVIYLLARHFFDKHTALLATAAASLFPSHILFSRLAYPSIYLCFAWLLTLLFFLKAERINEKTPASRPSRRRSRLGRAQTDGRAATDSPPAHAGRDEGRNKRISGSFWIIGLFLAGTASTLIKSQGLVFPGLLLFGRVIEKRTVAIRDEIAWVLFLSMIPVGFYFLTHPGVFATVLLYGGNMYGVSGFAKRLFELASTWWSLLTLFAVFAVISLRWFRSLPWPVWTLIATAIVTGFLLGPAHEYYATHLVLLALPIAVLLMHLTPPLRSLGLVALAITTLLFLGPHTLTPFMHPIYAKEPYWNENAERINSILRGEEEIVVLGYPGHHLRWYLEPKLLLGRYMDLENKTGTFLALKKDHLPVFSDAHILYEDAQLIIFERI